MSSPVNYTLEITQEAEIDLEAILNYTALQWGEQQVDIYNGIIEKALMTIQANPECGQSQYGVAKQIKGYKAGKHIIFYRVESTTIYIVRILHGSMNYSIHLDE
jgi:toxin ParE1/3/4